WFYLLHVLATAIFDRPAFTNCISHGIVLGSDGQKMSKSLRNYPDVNEVFNRDGSDAMRWFLMASSILDSLRKDFRSLKLYKKGLSFYRSFGWRRWGPKLYSKS